MKPQSSLFPFGLALVFATAALSAAAEPASAVSGSTRTSLAGSGGSFAPVLSSDGRYVLFVSQANNLVTNDDAAPYLDLFVRDLATGDTTLVSVNSSGQGGGDGNSNYPTISSSGQFVAFASEAGNLVANDTNKASDVFVRDLLSGVTTLVSVDVTGTGSAANCCSSVNVPFSGNPVISANGRWVVFESRATNLVVNDTNGLGDLFVRDLQTGTTLLVSVGAQSTSTLPSGGESSSAAITPDGNRIAFVSTAANLVPQLTNQLGEIYVREMATATTLWASADVASYFADFSNSFGCFNPVISADGRYVAFKASSAGVPDSVFVFHHDLQAGVTTLLTTNSYSSSWPALSADGRLVAYESSSNVYVWDSLSATSALVSSDASGAGPGNGSSHTPVMTPDGHTVAFLSTATDLVTNTTFSVTSGFQLFVRDLLTARTRLVSVNLQGAASDIDLGGIIPAISDDGGLVAFDSQDDNLAPDDLNKASDVFVRNPGSGTTQLVSQRHPTLLASTGVALSSIARYRTLPARFFSPAPGSPIANSISADGRYVAFTSFDNNFVAGDTNGFQDVFVRDLLTGALLPVSVNDDGTFATNTMGRQPVISANGQFVVFIWATSVTGLFAALLGDEEQAPLFWRDLKNGITLPIPGPVQGPGAITADGRLVAYPTGPEISTDIYLRDMVAGTNLLVASGGNPINPLFSPDGRWIVFLSQAINSGLGYNVFARDLASNTTTLISADANGVVLSGNSTGVVFSAGGGYLAFSGTYLDSSIAVQKVYRFDFLSRTTALVCTNCFNPSVSTDGRLVAFERKRSGTSIDDLWVADLQTGATELISVNLLGSGGGNGTSTSPLISGDGRFVVFASKASDLVDNDLNNATDIFVRDRLQGKTLLVSLNKDGTSSGNGGSSQPVMAADGRTVVFQSLASDLVVGDYNDKRDIFVLRLGAGELRVLTLNSVGSGTTTVLWSAVPGKSYQVQFKNEIDDPNWTTLPTIVVASGTTAAAVDNSGSFRNHRFYRVMLLP